MNIAVLVGLGLIFLIVGGDLLVRGASRLATILGIPSMIIGLTVVAFGTSTPELAVSINAALEGNSDISISNIVGSNIFNVLFILGLSSLIAPLVIQPQIIKRETPIMIGVSILLYLLSLGGLISRVEGAILFALIIIYTIWLVMQAIRKRSENVERVEESNSAYKTETKFSLVLPIVFVLSGLGIVMIGSEWLVDGATKMAKIWGVSDTVIGLTIVAAGTSLPEVIASVMATIKGERDIAVANVIGSNIYNILAILGLSGLIAPSGLKVQPSMMNFDYLVMIGVALLCWPFFKTGKQLSRWEGSSCLLLYIIYTFYLINF